MQLSSKAQLMTSFRGRLLLAAKTAAAEDPANNNSLLSDPWYAPTSRLKGRVDWDGCEYITSQHCLDALEVPMHARSGAVFRRLTAILRNHGWEPIRIKLNGVDGGGVTERVRGYQKKTNRLRIRTSQKSFPAKSTRPRPMSSARSFRVWRWTAGGLWRVRCVRLSPNVTR